MPELTAHSDCGHGEEGLCDPRPWRFRDVAREIFAFWPVCERIADNLLIRGQHSCRALGCDPRRGHARIIQRAALPSSETSSRSDSAKLMRGGKRNDSPAY